MRLRGHVYNDAGNPVSGAQVEVYTYQGQLAGTTTTGVDGSWTFTNLAPNLYRVKVSYGGIVRWLEGDSEIQVTRLVGSNGQTTPIEPLSVGTNQLQDNAVTTAKLANEAVTYPKLGTPLLVTGSSSSTIRYQESTSYTVNTNAWSRLRRFTFFCAGTVWIGFEASITSSGQLLRLQFRLASPTNTQGSGVSYDWITDFTFYPPASPSFSSYSSVVPVLPGCALCLDAIGNNASGYIRNLTVRFDPVTDPLQVVAV